MRPDEFIGHLRSNNYFVAVRMGRSGNYWWRLKKAVEEIVYTKEQEYKKQEQMLVPQSNSDKLKQEAKP